jgi:tetratricopeptide (TPR) repeat protein
MINRSISALALALAFALALAAKPLLAQDAADSAWNAGDHERARPLYAQRVAADSSDVRALHRLGLLLSWNSQFAESVRLFDRVLRLAPEDTSVAHARARVLSWAGRLNDAARAYQGLLAADPGNAEAVRGLARVTSWSGDLKAGEEAWRRAVAADPADVDARIGLSQVLRWRGQPGAALLEAEAAVQLAPTNNDAKLQLAWAEAAFAPRIAPSVSAEFDSDDNQLVTTSLAATAYLGRRVALTANGYLRRAEDNRPTIGNVESRGASLGARFELSAGWKLGVAGGVTDRQVSGADAAATYSASLASPSWLPVSGSVGYSRSVLDATSVLIERGVEIDAANLGLSAQLTPGLRVETGAVVSRFRGVTENDRLLTRLGLDARATSWLRLRPRISTFWFEKHVTEGYFNPDFYALGELGFGIDRYRGAWAFNAEVAPGAQQIGIHGDIRGALAARLGVGYSIAPGRDIGISFSMSNLGIERFEADATGYRYQAAVVSGSWGF